MRLTRARDGGGSSIARAHDGGESSNAHINNQAQAQAHTPLKTRRSRGRLKRFPRAPWSEIRRRGQLQGPLQGIHFQAAFRRRREPSKRGRWRLAAGHYASGGTRGSDSRGSTTQGPIRGVRKRGGDVGRLATMASGVSTRTKQAVDLSVPREAGAATHTDARRPRRGGRPINNRASLGWIRARGCQHRHVHA